MSILIWRFSYLPNRCLPACSSFPWFSQLCLAIWLKCWPRKWTRNCWWSRSCKVLVFDLMTPDLCPVKKGLSSANSSHVRLCVHGEYNVSSDQRCTYQLGSDVEPSSCPTMPPTVIVTPDLQSIVDVLRVCHVNYAKLWRLMTVYFCRSRNWLWPAGTRNRLWPAGTRIWNWLRPRHRQWIYFRPAGLHRPAGRLWRYHSTLSALVNHWQFCAGLLVRR